MWLSVLLCDLSYAPIPLAFVPYRLLIPISPLPPSSPPNSKPSAPLPLTDHPHPVAMSSVYSSRPVHMHRQSKTNPVPLSYGSPKVRLLYQIRYLNFPLPHCHSFSAFRFRHGCTEALELSVGTSFIAVSVRTGDVPEYMSPTW